MSQKTRDADKPKKMKLVRDSFCMPKDEYVRIEALKTRALGLSLAVKKSELLRAGLKALDGLSDAALKKALGAVPTLKTGRPAVEAATDATPAIDTPAPASSAADAAPTVARAPRARRTAVAKPLVA